MPRSARKENTRSLIEKFLYPAKGPGCFGKKWQILAGRWLVEILFSVQTYPKFHMKNGFSNR